MGKKHHKTTTKSRRNHNILNGFETYGRITKERGEEVEEEG